VRGTTPTVSGPAWIRKLRPGWRRCVGSGPAGSAQPVPLAGRDGAGHGAQQFAVVADDGHLGAVHPQCDALPGEVVADVELPARQADKAGAVDHALDLDGGAGPGPQRRRPGRPGAVSGQAGPFDWTQPGGQGLEPGAAQQDMQDGFVSPDGDLAACQGGAEPDLLAADLQVPGRRHHPAVTLVQWFASGFVRRAEETSPSLVIPIFDA
jgi:hypothetical protein